LQQASKAIEGLGVFSLEEGVISTRHLVHTTDGKVIGEWGMRKWMQSKISKANIHIARQSLRFALLEQLGGHDKIKWGHQLVDLKEVEGETVELSFEVARSKLPRQILWLEPMVFAAQCESCSLVTVLPLALPRLYCDIGICPLAVLNGIDRSLLDSATVFQTANGNERIYIMPYDSKSVMWQLSFPMSEEAKS
jgi:hypothetical protein